MDSSRVLNYDRKKNKKIGEIGWIDNYCQKY